jgi:alginate O-acetyltransferase complex protein AlgI
VIVAVGARLLGRSAAARKAFLGGTSALMLLAIPGFGPRSLSLVVALILLTYAIGLLLAKGALSDGRGRKLAAGAGITGVLAFLAFFKYGPVQELFLPATAGLLRMIGVSYFSFRMIHFLVEAYRRKIENLDLLTYIDYILFFPAFISGPINRYGHFAAQLAPRIPSGAAADLRAGMERIVHGLFKKIVLAQLLYPYVLSSRPDALAAMGPIDVVLGLYAYAFYFYFDFAGYTDLAVGCARLIGLELPENFNNPFLKRNIRELWTNWHISLTSWLVDYIYWPLVRRFRSLEFFRRRPVFLSNLGMIITFIACGMWHGESANFVLWGAYHGLGIAALTVYQREKRKVRRPFLKRYFSSRLSAAWGTLLTFHFFAFGLALFVLDVGKLRVLVAALVSGL